MRAGTATLKSVLMSDFDYNYVADFFYNGIRQLQNAPITNVQLTDDSTSLVQGSGSFTIAYQGDFAESIAPKNVGDLLSPFGTQVVISVLVTNGDGFSERIQIGVYLISETPTILTQRFLFNTAVVSKGDLIDVNIKDLMFGIQGDQFNTPGTPPQLASVWIEVQRLAQLPVTKTVTDGAISTTVAYQSDKLQAIYDLANVLDAVACMTPDGTVGMRPNVWPAVVDTIMYGDGGTLVSVGRAMANDTVYNAFVVRTDATDGTAILFSAELTTGPLRTTNLDGSLSPYRRKPVFYSSPYITTQAQAQAYALTQLPRVSSLRAVSVALTEAFNPLRDLGDVVTVSRLGESFNGRVTNISRSPGPTQVTTVAVGQ